MKTIRGLWRLSAGSLLLAVATATIAQQHYPARPIRLVVAWAPGGSGSNLALVAELFKTAAGINMTHIPYKGGGPAGVAVISGEAQMMFAGIASVLPFVNSNRMVALALTSPNRSPLLPEVPTFEESGLRGLDVGQWFALLTPAATPREIIARLNAEVIRLGATLDYRTQMEKQGFEPFTSSPEQFSMFMKAELDKWGKVIKVAGIKPD